MPFRQTYQFPGHRLLSSSQVGLYRYTVLSTGFVGVPVHQVIETLYSNTHLSKLRDIHRKPQPPSMMIA